MFIYPERRMKPRTQKKRLPTATFWLIACVHQLLGKYILYFYMLLIEILGDFVLL